jgi:23S rRNA (uracil1939-C5)-methyltransferase
MEFSPFLLEGKKTPSSFSLERSAIILAMVLNGTLEMVLQIEKVVAGGYGLARDAGQVVLVAGALAGERVRVQATPSKGVLKARLLEVLEASPDRVEVHDLPPTLDLAHAEYAAQLEIKRGFVLEALVRIGKLEGEVEPTRASPDRWHYRSVTQYAVSGPVEQRQLAYRERGSHRPRAVKHDPVASDPINTLLSKLEPGKLGNTLELVLRSSFANGDVVAALIGDAPRSNYSRAAMHLADLGVSGVSLARAGKRRFTGKVGVLWGEPTILERYGNLDVSVSASGFAQVNPKAATELYLEAVAWAGTGGTALDLYGGAGALGLQLAHSYQKVMVLDIALEGLDRGYADAERLGLTNVQYHQGDAMMMPSDIDTILLDPPRAGLDTEVLVKIQDSSAEKIIYISCDPATWARDVGRLVRQGWNLKRVIPWDFYPQTSHVEVLSLLER